MQSWAVQAQIVQSCQDFGALDLNIVEPAAENSKDFANGKTNISVINTEISNGAYHILVTSPPFDDKGVPTCQIISDITNDGFEKILMPMLEADYDPTKGLSFDVPVQPLGDSSKTVRLLIDLNQSNGKLDALFSGF